MSGETVETIESTPEEGTIQEQEAGTTARLFGDLMEQEDTSVEATPEPVKAEEEVDDSPDRKRDEKGHFTSEAEADSEYLSEKDFGKKLKAKIDGHEIEITVQDAVRGYQTDQYLTKKGQRVAEEANRLKTLKPESIEIQATAPEAANADDDFTREYINPALDPLKKENAALKAEIAEIKGALAPTIYEANLKALDNALKKQGHNDFMEYRGRVEERISAGMAEDPTFDSPANYVAIYKDLKIQDLEKARTAAPPKEEKKNPDARPKPKLVAIEGSSSTPSGADDSAATVAKLKQNAFRSGRISDYAKIFEQMG